MLAYVTRPVQARLQEHVVSPYLRSPTSSALHLPPRWDLSVRGGRGFGALRRVCGTDRRARDRAAALRPPRLGPGKGLYRRLIRQMNGAKSQRSWCLRWSFPTPKDSMAQTLGRPRPACRSWLSAGRWFGRRGGGGSDGDRDDKRFCTVRAGLGARGAGGGDLVTADVLG